MDRGTDIVVNSAVAELRVWGVPRWRRWPHLCGQAAASCHGESFLHWQRIRHPSAPGARTADRRSSARKERIHFHKSINWIANEEAHCLGKGQLEEEEDKVLRRKRRRQLCARFRGLTMNILHYEIFGSGVWGQAALAIWRWRHPRAENRLALPYEKKRDDIFGVSNVGLIHLNSWMLGFPYFRNRLHTLYNFIIYGVLHLESNFFKTFLYNETKEK